MSETCLVLRLAGPMQSWGSASQFNQRRTDDRPTKSGVIGLLAAASGRRRSDPIEDLVALTLAVRIDQPGSLLRDYHTVSDYRGLMLPIAETYPDGRQKRGGPKRATKVTTRFYLQDAVFVVAVGGDRAVLEGLAQAIRRPAFPLALGRRSCVPTQPILLTTAEGGDLWSGDPTSVIHEVPWQAADHWRRRQGGYARLAATWDDAEGVAATSDVPVSFEPGRRRMLSRRVTHDWVTVGSRPDGDDPHDPFAALGW